MKIAIFSTGNLNDMKGVMNYVHEKALRFKSVNDDTVFSTIFFLVTRYTGVLSLFKNKNKFIYRDGEIIQKDGVDYHIIVRDYCLTDMILSYLFGNFVPARFANKVADIMSSYDVISAHQLPCIYTAMLVKRYSGKPYIATWHGSDINVSPRQSTRLFNATKSVIECADMNFFVSKGLMMNSSYITTKGTKTHIYTGPSGIFQQYSIEKRLSLRKRYGIDNVNVVLFAGNLIPIKNVLILPEVFEKLSQKAEGIKIAYWIVGNGELEEKLVDGLNAKKLPYKMFGKLSPSAMPDIMNCADILIMPSLNEGFPLSILEARSCGCNVVGSRVGGIPESAGQNNTFELNDKFVDNITDRMKDMLLNNEKPTPLDEECSWTCAVQKELKVISGLIQRI